ncbi:MAG: hypothetical protein LBJ91_00990 [Clostridiales Family XIII bacterium]|nr:hypothetical protein [Clostridiales Family XIII bacterium]
MKFLDCDEVKSMEAIAEKNEGVRNAVAKYKALTADENARILAQLREKDRRLEKGRLDYARDQGVAKGRVEGRAERDAEIARHMADMGKTEAEIAEILGKV